MSVPELGSDDQQDLLTIGSWLAKVIDAENEGTILGELLSRLRFECRLPAEFMIGGALLNDFVRVAEASIAADGHVSDEEMSAVWPLMARFARFLSYVRTDFRRFDALSLVQVPRFLMFYKADEGPFGFHCDETQWIGLDVCRRASAATGDTAAIDLYMRGQLRRMDLLLQLGGLTSEESAARERLHDILETKRRSEVVATTTSADSRIAAYCSGEGPAIFSAVAHAHQVWERDPFDVESVHLGAREVFERLIERATQAHPGTAGRILLVRGDSGAGKTHLMRALRNHVHGQQLGYVGYMQMTSRGEDYSRYVLVNLIDSLQKEYDPPTVDASGLMNLSDAIAEHGAISAEELAHLREGELDLAREDIVSPLVDKLLAQPQYKDFDPDLLRVFLYLQPRDSRIRPRALKYLRCEHLNTYDRKLLGDISSTTDEDAAQRRLHQLGRLMWQSDGRALVLLVDQLEDMFHLEDAAERIPRAFDVLRETVESVPNAIVVITCLTDVYSRVREQLTRSVVDRLETDPAPIQLKVERSLEEIQAIVSVRLQHLYETLGARYREDEPLFPFRLEDMQALTNLRTRDVLDWCRNHQEACVSAGKLLEPQTALPAERVAPPDEPDLVLALEQAWNDFRTGFADDPPDADDELLEMLAAAAGTIGEEFDPPFGIAVQQEGAALVIEEEGRASLAAICNRSPQGGHLQRQIEALAKQAGSRATIMVRSSEFPSNPTAKVVARMGELLRQGGRKVVVDEADWRTLLAFRAFAASESNRPGFTQWRVAERPLARVRSLRILFALDDRQRRSKSQETSISTDAPSDDVDPHLDPAPDPLDTLVDDGATEVDATQHAARSIANGMPSVAVGWAPITKASSAETPIEAMPIDDPPEAGGESGSRSDEDPSVFAVADAAMDRPGTPEFPSLAPTLDSSSLAELAPDSVAKVETDPSYVASTTQAPEIELRAQASSNPSDLTDPPQNELDGSVRIGRAVGFRPTPIEIELRTLATHAVFLGSAGSGTTTFALNVIERALERGIPVLLVDRQGDLCRYAHSDWWQVEAHSTEETARKHALAERIRVAMYTPGQAAGRDLRIPLAPAGLADMRSQERQLACRQAAAGIAVMLGYKSSATDLARLSVLTKAIEVLGTTSNQPPTLQGIADIIHDENPALVNAIGKLDTKHFGHVADHLEMFRINQGEFIEGVGETLDPARLLGPPSDATDAVPLSIITTKFLRDNHMIEFWISRLLAELARWATRNPNPVLRALVLFDEADVYLPATRKPPTKESMQDLMRRSRSAGLGVLLATQNPGGLDYKSRDNVRTWFLGRIAESTAVQKMQALLSECSSNIKGKLPRQNPGEFFMLQGGRATEIKADKSWLEPERVSDPEILGLAAATMRHARS